MADLLDRQAAGAALLSEIDVALARASAARAGHAPVPALALERRGFVSGHLTLLSDLNKTTAKAYDVVFPMLAGVGDTAARAAFVVGKDGTVKYAEQTPTPKDLPNFQAIKAALANA